MKNKKKEIKSRIISIIFMTVLLVVSTMYVYYPNKTNLVSALTFLRQNTNNDIYIEELSSGINLAEAYPITDEEGLETSPYQFKLVNTTNHDITYQLLFHNQLDEITNRDLEPLAAKYLRYSIAGNDDLVVDTIPDSEIIYTGTIQANSEITLEFRFWLGDSFDNDAIEKTYLGRIQVDEI